MTKTVMILFKSGDSAFPDIFEALRISMSMIGMDLMPKLLFCCEGVNFLLKNSKHSNDEKYTLYLKTMADIAGINVLSTSLKERHLSHADLDETLNIQVISARQASSMVSRSDSTLAV